MAAGLVGARALLGNGGTDALIVDESVDPRWAAGQICVAVERVYVSRASPRTSSRR